MANELPFIQEANVMDKAFHNDVVSAFLTGNLDPSIDFGKVNRERVQSLTQHSDYSPENRKILVEALHKQYASLNQPPNEDSAVHQNIQALLDSNTITVTTGQQIHIFLGPLFVIYKIVSCINAAREIQKNHPGYRVIPVFWMASEDHDFDEIRSIQLYNQQYVWDRPGKGSVGRFSPKTLLPLVDELADRLDQNEFNATFIDLCRKAYSNHETFAQATQYLVHHLFEKDGLVVIDPDTPSLKSLYKDIIRKDVLDQSLQQAMDTGIGALKEAGIKPPINTRPINHFFLSEEGRNRIEYSNDRFELIGLDKTYHADELSKLIDTHPETFSPNALLRPIYQQRILPNIEYICGGSEFIYWLELSTLFDHLNVFKPALNIRKSAFILGSGIQKTFDRYQILYESCLLNDESFNQLLAQKSSENMEVVQNAKTKLEEAISDLEKISSKLNLSAPSKSFRKSLDGILSNVEVQFERWNDEIVSQNEHLNKVKRQKDKIRSSSHLQERNEFIINHLPTLLPLLKNGQFESISQNEATFANLIIA